jgi:hypothetical protein
MSQTVIAHRLSVLYRRDVSTTIPNQSGLQIASVAVICVLLKKLGQKTSLVQISVQRPRSAIIHVMSVLRDNAKHLVVAAYIVAIVAS